MDLVYDRLTGALLGQLVTPAVQDANVVWVLWQGEYRSYPRNSVTVACSP